MVMGRKPCDPPGGWYRVGGTTTRSWRGLGASPTWTSARARAVTARAFKPPPREGVSLAEELEAISRTLDLRRR